MICGIHHIAIICSDYRKSKHFYHEILGLPIIREVYLEARKSFKLDLWVPGGIQIELFSFENAPERPSYPEALGLRHLAFKVQNLEKTIEALKQFGYSCESIRVDPYTQKRFTFFCDPDQLPLELYEGVCTTEPDVFPVSKADG